MNKHDTVLELSVQAIGRMPYYLDYLNELYSSGVTTVSAPNVAAHFGFSEIQVRKDFSAVSSIQGRPKHGFSIPELIDDMEMILGYRNCRDAVLVGAGSLGTALLEYDGFNKYGIDIVAVSENEYSYRHYNGACRCRTGCMRPSCRRRSKGNLEFCAQAPFGSGRYIGAE